jgi:hypothetical protein
MRTKTLLCMAALAAGVATSMAQNVYSLNIVGYCNVPCNSGFHFYSNPLDTGTNGANQVFDNSGPGFQWDGCEIQQWNGVGFIATLFDSSSPTGFTDGGGVNPVPPPTLGSAKGFVFNNTSPSNNIVFVGTVRTGTNTTTFPANDPVRKSMGSPLPYAGTITSLGFTNGPMPLDACEFIELRTTIPGNGGASSGFKTTLWDSGSGTGFTDVPGNPVPEPVVPIAGGFLFGNPNNTAVVWTQVLNP